MKAKSINESLTKKDNKEQVINYSGIIDSAWQPLIAEARDLYNITFDLENNDLVEKRVFRKKANLRIGQPVTSVVPIELWEAGGDWEWPLMYFKVCIQSDHFLTGFDGEFPKKYPWDFDRSEKNGGKYGGLGSRCFVVIPPRKAGNKYTECRDCKTAKYAAWQDEYPDFDKKLVKITDEDREKAWKWIDKYLSDAIEKRYKRLDLEENPLGMDPMDVIPEGIIPASPKDAKTQEEIRDLKPRIEPASPDNSSLDPKPINEELSGSEALYGFAGWMTGREEPVTMSSKDDAALVARLVADFIDANELEDPKGNWHKELKHPKTNES